MAEKVVLHIGAPKSGTTFLQTTIWRNRRPLRKAGVLVPGRERFDMNRAAIAARHRRLGKGRVFRTWRAMRARSRKWTGTSLFSCEWFSLVDAEQARRTVKQLGPGDVHVVYTARSLVTLVPAAWQETLKLGARHTLEEFVQQLDEPEARWGWWTLDPAVALARWEPAVGADNIHVVTVPPPGSPRHLLLDRFASVVGFDPSVCNTSSALANESLSVESAELIRRVAPLAGERIDWDQEDWNDQYRWLRRYLGHELLVPRAGHRLRLPDELAGRIAERAESSVQALRDRGYRVAGDLDELITPASPAEGRTPADVPTEELLDLAVDVMATMLKDVRAATLRAEQAEQRHHGRPDAPEDPGPTDQ